MPLSTYFANKILDCIFNNTAISAIATPYISLHTGNPGLTGASEVTGGSYARQSGSFIAAASKALDNDAAIEFPGMPSATVTHIGVWDAVSGGNFIWGDANTGTQSVAAGNTFKLPIGVVDASFT